MKRSFVRFTLLSTLLFSSTSAISNETKSSIDLGLGVGLVNGSNFSYSLGYQSRFNSNVSVSFKYLGTPLFGDSSSGSPGEIVNFLHYISAAPAWNFAGGFYVGGHLGILMEKSADVRTLSGIAGGPLAGWQTSIHENLSAGVEVLHYFGSQKVPHFLATLSLNL